LSLSADYRSHTRVALSGGDSGLQTSAFTLWNLSATLTHDPWNLLFYATNLTDKRAILAPPTALSPSDNPAFIPLASDYIINRPREVGLRLFYSF
jgi:outer membrane receptor protein involved in Fe transport